MAQTVTQPPILDSTGVQIVQALDGIAEAMNGKIGIRAMYEESPALQAHAIGDYIFYDEHFYKVKSAISVGDSLVLNTNIEDAGFTTDTVVYVEGIGSPAGSITLSSNSASLSDEYETATITATIVGDGEVSVSSNDTDVCTASISSNTITIQATGSGTATVTVTLADGQTYTGTTASITVSSTYTPAAQLTIGNTYFFGGFYWTAAEAIDGGVCLQSQGMTSGAWPGYKLTTDYTGTKNYGSANTGYASNIDGDNIANYDDVTSTWYTKYSAVEKTGVSYGSGLFLVSNAKCGTTTSGTAGSGNYLSALKIAAANYNQYANIGTVNSTNQCWYILSNGNVYNNNDQKDAYAIALAFNLDTTKVKLAGPNNDHILLKTESYPTTTAVSWTNGTDAQIAEVVAAADNGIIDLYGDCGWRVGDERSVSLSAIASSGTYDGVSWSVPESHDAQTVTFVLMHRGLYNVYDPVGPKKKCNFIAGMKNCLNTEGAVNVGSGGGNPDPLSWINTKRRSWCNSGFRGALPSGLVNIFKKFECITGVWLNNTVAGGTNIVTPDYFAYPAEKEVFGSATYSCTHESNALTQFTWYATSANIIKTRGGSASYWFERSPRYDDSNDVCEVRNDGVVWKNGWTSSAGISPFGCI